MNERNTILLIVGIVVALAMVGVVIGASGGDDMAAGVFLAPFGLLFNPITLIILLIVFLVRRNNQQQQQQIVIQMGDTGGQKVRCPKCNELNPAVAAFCGDCGQGLGQVS